MDEAVSKSRSSAHPVYVFAQLTIHDRARYQRYVREFSSVLARFAGQLLVADEAPRVLEGSFTGDKVVLLRFASEDAYRAWAESPDYQSILQDRLAGASATALLLHGMQ